MLLSFVLTAGLLGGTLQDTYTITHGYQQGQTLKYSVTRSAEDEMDTMARFAAGQWTVELKVSLVEDGKIVFDAVRTPLELGLQDETEVPEEVVTHLFAPSKATITISEDGKVEVKGHSPRMNLMSGGSHWLHDVILAKLPKGPIKVGDTWSEERELEHPLPRASGATKEVVTYKLLGLESVDGVACYRVSATSVREDTMSAEMDVEESERSQGIKLRFVYESKYTLDVARSDARVVKVVGIEEAEMTAENTDLPISQTSTVKVEVKLLKK
jgi:hypothetical protein